MGFVTPQFVFILATVFGGVALDPTSAVIGVSSATLLSLGLFGSAILERLFERDESDTDEGDDDLLGDDDIGGLDGSGDEFGDMDGWGDDVFGDVDDEEDSAELEHRLDELEGEVAGLSSTVGTVRSENKEISTQVEDIGENVRKLLDIYEMVTRGINPFVDDAPGSGAFDEGSLGLFEDDGDEDEEELDDSIANADAEGFFDEDLADESFDDDLSGDDPFGEDDIGEDDIGDENGVTDEMATEINDDGKSFAELKDEYDSGEADWASDLGEDGEADDFDDLGFDDEVGEADDLGSDDDADDLGFDDELATDDFDMGGDLPEFTEDEAVSAATDALLEQKSPAEETTTAADVDETPAEEATDETTDDAVDDEWDVTDAPTDGDGGFEFGSDVESERGKPYLTSLPETYVGDLLVLEWLEYLVDESDPTDATRAIHYYERVEWISEHVADSLADYLVGFGDVDYATADLPGTSELTPSHHTRSLKYIEQLDESSPEQLMLDRWPGTMGGTDGL